MTNKDIDKHSVISNVEIRWQNDKFAWSENIEQLEKQPKTAEHEMASESNVNLMPSTMPTTTMIATLTVSASDANNDYVVEYATDLGTSSIATTTTAIATINIPKTIKSTKVKDQERKNANNFYSTKGNNRKNTIEDRTNDRNAIKRGKQLLPTTTIIEPTSTIDVMQSGYLKEFALLSLLNPNDTSKLLLLSSSTDLPLTTEAFASVNLLQLEDDSEWTLANTSRTGHNLHETLLGNYKNQINAVIETTTTRASRTLATTTPDDRNMTISLDIHQNQNKTFAAFNNHSSRSGDGFTTRGSAVTMNVDWRQPTEIINNTLIGSQQGKLPKSDGNNISELSWNVGVMSLNGVSTPSHSLLVKHQNGQQHPQLKYHHGHYYEEQYTHSHAHSLHVCPHGHPYVHQAAKEQHPHAHQHQATSSEAQSKHPHLHREKNISHSNTFSNSTQHNDQNKPKYSKYGDYGDNGDKDDNNSNANDNAANVDVIRKNDTLPSSGVTRISAKRVNNKNIPSKSLRTDAPMLNYIFDTFSTSNKHHHHDQR